MMAILGSTGALEQEFASFYSRKMLSPAKFLRAKRESVVG